MDKNIITCEMAKDLIPLYSEGLCSEESRKAVENHLAECESCRRLLETPVEQEQITSIPEEKNVFKKLNRKMKHRKLLIIMIIILSITLALILAAVGYLSVGQIVKGTGMYSFETIAQSAEARKVVNYILDGDFRRYVDAIYDGGLRSLKDPETYEKIRQKKAAELSQAYEAAFGSAEAESVSIYSQYDRLDETSAYYIRTYCIIRYNEGSVLGFALNKSYDNRFAADIGELATHDADAGNAFYTCFTMINNMNGRDEKWNKQFLARVMRTDSQVQQNIDSKVYSIVSEFAPEYKDTVRAAVTAFYEKGYAVTDCIFTADDYDDEINRYFDMYLTAADEQGTAVMTARIYRGYDGFIKPETITVYRNGCTDELAESLEHFFG